MYIHQCDHFKIDCCFAPKNYCRWYKFKLKLRFCNHASKPKCKKEPTRKNNYYLYSTFGGKCNVRYGMVASPLKIYCCNESINDGIL